MGLYWFIYEWRYSVVVTVVTTVTLLSLAYLASGAMNVDNAPWYFSSDREYQGMLLLVILLPALCPDHHLKSFSQIQR